MGITKEYVEEVEWSCGDYAAQSILHYDTNETPEFTMYAISREMNAERSDKLTLRQFMDKFNITAEDCQKAFESEATDDN